MERWFGHGCSLKKELKLRVMLWRRSAFGGVCVEGKVRLEGDLAADGRGVELVQLNGPMSRG